MLALTGAVADGWLPTMEYLTKGIESLRESNERIDQAATSAGRSPNEVRRLMNFMNVRFSESGRGLLNGPTDAWVDQLAQLALNHGVSAFLIGGDDHYLTERFASDVAPRVREIVEQERTLPKTASPSTTDSAAAT